MNTRLDILIMAAGLGTRMRSSLAKVLHRLDGRPLINHVADTALALHPAKVCVVVGHQAGDVEAAVLIEPGRDKVEFVTQQQQLGTGDAVNSAREIMADRDSVLLVLSGDVPMIRTETLQELIAAHHESRAACTVLTVELGDPTGYGRVIRDGSDMFDRIVEQKDASVEELSIREINSGIYCFDTKKLFDALTQISDDNAQGEFYLTDVPHILRKQGDIVGIHKCGAPAEVEGVNDRRQLAAMEKQIRRQTIKRLMVESGVTFIDPKASYVSARAMIGADTVIYPNVSIEGDSIIGENSVIRPGTRITNSRIGSGVEIRDNCFITDSEVGDNCTVGPMAHLRGHAVMESDAKVGNFVEMKKSTLGRGSKASHLTYLGDATIGLETNIGAGTITCNYDGKNKHETHIGDNVKIGSDTMLIAPVTVSDGAVTGAGSVVTKDVEANTLVAGVPAKVIRKLDEDVDGGTDREDPPANVTADEALEKMRSFGDRKEQFVAAIKKSKD